MKIADYLGRHVSRLLESDPFNKWLVERSVENDLEEQIVHYVFNESGVELRCDNNDKISVIFLHSADVGLSESLLGVSFLLNRTQVQSRFGIPSKSGEKINDPILGEYGAWDRFTHTSFSIHFEYCPDSDQINKITLMRNDVVS